MGFMDGFTSDGTVDMKHTEYYNLMREAAKAELIGNAVKADVPGFYIQAMITGKKPEFLNTLDAEEESTGFHAEYEQITGAVVTIFEAWMKENGVESTAASLHRLIDTLAQNRIEELRTIKVNQEDCKQCQDGSNYISADELEEKAHELKDGESEDTDHGND